jgi:cytochrome c-type biogenesis protein CcmH
MVTRRKFLAGALGAGAVWRRPAQDAPLAGEGNRGTLRDPWSAGRSHNPTSDLDNNPTITAIEHKLRCPCPCGLDIYTCRTTDFTCSYSPEAHRQVVALYRQGRSEQEIVDAFVGQYGERALMAPPPRGFNLAGYLVPGSLVVLLGAALVLMLRRRGVAEAAGRAAPAAATPLAAPRAGTGPAIATATPEELERLRRELELFDR